MVHRREKELYFDFSSTRTKQPKSRGAPVFRSYHKTRPKHTRTARKTKQSHARSAHKSQTRYSRSSGVRTSQVRVTNYGDAAAITDLLKNSTVSRLKLNAQDYAGKYSIRNYGKATRKKPSTSAPRSQKRVTKVTPTLRASTVTKVRSQRARTSRKSQKENKRKQPAVNADREFASSFIDRLREEIDRIPPVARPKTQETRSRRAFPDTKHDDTKHYVLGTNQVQQSEVDRSKSTSWGSINITNLDMADLEVKNLLGEGAFSKVYLAHFKPTLHVLHDVPPQLRHQPLALKVVVKDKQSRSQARNFMWERLALSSLNHPFMVDFLGSFSDEKHFCMLMEFAIGGEILFHFERAQRFENSIGRFFIAELICVLEYLHSNDFIYRDLKPENILLDNRGHIKLVDFGFAKQVGVPEKTYTLCGSIEYVAPEVLHGMGHGRSVDVWSLGVLTYELLVGHLPFPTQGCRPYEVLDIIKRTRVKLPRYLTKTARDFIRHVLVLDPKKRLGCGKEGISELQTHPWFDSVDWVACNKGELPPPIQPKYYGQDDTSNFETARFDMSQTQPDYMLDF